MPRPSRPDAGDARALAEELVESLAAIATPPPGFARSESSSPPSTPAGQRLEGPRALLENGSRFVAPYLPAETRLRTAKSLALRLLKIVTRDQTVFNSAVLESLRIAYREIEAALDGVTHESARLSREAAEQGRQAAAAAERHADTRAEAALRLAEERRAEGERRLAAELASALGRLESVQLGQADEVVAREALGRELLATQRRVDALELDRDALLRRAEEARALSLRLDDAETERARLEEQLRLMRLEWTVLRSTLAGGLPAPGAALRQASQTAPASDPLRSGLYVDFERQFRGSEAEIRERQGRDAALFRDVPGPVADLGCGRGELLEVLLGAGIPALGCDSNPMMVAGAREKGLDVEVADLFSWLGARSDGSLGGVTAYQVVEHLPPARLFDLVELAARKLAVGGRLLFETINPESVYAMRWFWMDLTHVRPVPAPSLAQLLSASGFRDVTTELRSPVPAGDALAAGTDPALEPVARLLFAPQDYIVTGVK
jgi:SAM-dependent methyltransferase